MAVELSFHGRLVERANDLNNEIIPDGYRTHLTGRLTSLCLALKQVELRVSAAHLLNAKWGMPTSPCCLPVLIHTNIPGGSRRRRKGANENRNERLKRNGKAVSAAVIFLFFSFSFLFSEPFPPFVLLLLPT
jgi:hypothetical protein